MYRFFDILFSASALLLFLPLFLVIIIILRFTGEGEIFYLQDRIGKNGKVFKLFKFATMLKNSPKLGSGSITLKNDPRVLVFGFFLRKTKINELLQLINVLLGQMSLVGPRPMTYETFNAYVESQKTIISSVSPGLSGIGSLVFRDEENLLSDSITLDPIEFYRNIIAPYKAKLEISFIENKSLLNYFIVIFLTILILIRPNYAIIWKFFPFLPLPPEEIKKHLGLLE